MNKIKQLFEKIQLFLKEVKVEMQKVTWPTKAQILNYTIVVMIAVVVLSLIIGIEDKFLGWLLKGFLNL